MKNIFVITWLFCQAVTGFAQSQVMVSVKDAKNQEPLIGASIKIVGTQNGTVTDMNGMAVIQNLTNGSVSLRVSFVGYIAQERAVTIPSKDTLTFLLEGDKLLDEVVVTSTRSSRTIDDIPTRVENISGEELEEKGNMNSSNISMLLRESTGIQVQQTSATSANMNFRIQGLDGRYTQLLQNGMPLYAGFSSGLSIMQIPPLDLKRVEIIKGSSSTLYGGGAIAGMINLITKEPNDERETLLQIVGTSAGGADLNGYFSKKITKKLGITVFSSYHIQQPYDPNKDQFSDIPLQRRFNFNPRFFYQFNERTSLHYSINTSFERREGGFIPKIRNESNALSNFIESNQSRRINAQFKFEHRFGKNAALYVKNSINFFERTIQVPDYLFSGNQTARFAEIGLSKFSSKVEWVGGINLWTDKFKEKPLQTTTLRNSNLITVGAFLQNVVNLSEKLVLESGLRLDHQNEYGTFLLPRLSALYRINSNVSMRFGGGLGYKAPTIFLQESEQVSFRNVLPIDLNNTKAEKSQGLNLDFNYKTTLGENVSIVINQLFFVTQLNQPLVLNPAKLASNILQFENADGSIIAKGFETNLKITYEDFKLFTFYSLIDTKRNFFNLKSPIPLTARHRTGSIIMWEKEDNFRIGYEVYYTGKQELTNGATTRSYATMGLMAEKKWEKFSIYTNFENFLDVRQSRWQSMYSGTVQSPQFVQEIFAPTDGRVISLGLKLKL